MQDHIQFHKEEQILDLLDQRLLPTQESRFLCRSCQDVITAIQTMVVRGAPAIGVSAAFACVLAVQDVLKAGEEAWQERLRMLLAQLAQARPTAVNLSWAVKRMEKILDENKEASLQHIHALFTEQAYAMQQEDIASCQAIGRYSLELVQTGDTILTHCNAGALATAGYGTALGVVRAAWDAGKQIKVIADETRPLLQGARLTAWELHKDNIPVTVSCDDECAWLMSKNMVQLVVVGADRIACNGDTANKIGTLGVAIMAKHFGIPFYVAAPVSTIDSSLANGSLITIEQRAACEVSQIGSTQITPTDVPVFNYAFDVTPAALITGIITDKGLFKGPYDFAFLAE